MLCMHAGIRLQTGSVKRPKYTSMKFDIFEIQEQQC